MRSRASQRFGALPVPSRPSRNASQREEGRDHDDELRCAERCSCVESGGVLAPAGPPSGDESHDQRAMQSAHGAGETRPDLARLDSRDIMRQTQHRVEKENGAPHKPGSATSSSSVLPSLFSHLSSPFTQSCVSSPPASSPRSSHALWPRLWRRSCQTSRIRSRRSSRTACSKWATSSPLSDKRCSAAANTRSSRPEVGIDRTRR